MEPNSIMLTFLILFIAMTTVFCSTKFQISKFNMCPPENFKFLSLVNLSLEQCVDECRRRKHCQAVGFKRLYNLCELFTTYTSTSASRGKCLIVNKDDFQGQVAANEINVCDEWEVFQSSEMDVTCSKQECQVKEGLEDVNLLGNLNELGAKKIEFCTQSGIVGKQVQTLECFTDGKWEITDRKWESSSTPDTVCLSVVERMTKLYCSQTYVHIFTAGLTQPDASVSCASLGGKLAKIDKEWKLDAIEAFIRDCPVLTSGQYWVDGYTQRNQIDEWKFSDGTLVPMSKHFWKDHAPNVQRGVSNCIRMVKHSKDEKGDYRFDDIYCQKELSYVCEQN